jgi:large subunit ribosomal protein L9e
MSPRVVSAIGPMYLETRNFKGAFESEPVLTLFLLIVKVTIKSRLVTVEGPRGTYLSSQRVKEWGILTVAIGKLTKNLNHLAVNFSHPKKDVINIELHHGARKNVATLRTVRTLINNLIIGVTKGFKYKMRYVYAHFPINVNVDKNNETGLYEVEIRYVTSISSKDCRSGFG